MDTIYTLSESTHIVVDIIEDVLERYGIKVPSPEDDEREPNNSAVFYGSVYGEVTNRVEDYLIDLLERHKPGTEVVSGVYGGKV